MASKDSLGFWLISLVGIGLAAERGDIRRDVVRFRTPQAEIHL